MKWQGGKDRLVKHFLPILEGLRGNRIYLEPFVGGGAVISALQGPRIGSDVNSYVVALLRAMQGLWCPPHNVSEDLYQQIRTNPEAHDPALVAFVMAGCSFGAKWGGGYARGKAADGSWRNYADESARKLEQQREGLRGAALVACPYLAWGTPKGMLVYCDPPYKGTTTYAGTAPFDHDLFWTTMSVWAKHNIVLVSERDPSPPAQVELLWEMPYKGGIRKKEGNKPNERLYRVR